MENSKACNLVWFRRDLRVEDNPALLAAANAPGVVLPIFIWCPAEEGEFQPGRHSRWWLKQSLIHLDASLASYGCSLLLQKGNDTLSVLVNIARATGSTQIFCNHLYADPITVARDRRVKQRLLEYGIFVHNFNCDTLHEPWEIYDEQGHAFTTFAGFWNRFLRTRFEPDMPDSSQARLFPYREYLDLISFAGNLPTPCSIEELCLEDESEKSSNELLARTWSPGCKHANDALQAFLVGPLNDYTTSRETADNSTSHLSPYLHFGELSIRKLYNCIRSKQRDEEQLFCPRRNAHLFLRAIGLREYSRYISFHFPFTQEQSLLKNFPWRNDEIHFKAWKLGKTGYPLVDAAMRELWSTGWLHCKLRVVTSSFLIKFLQLPWTWGIKYFWDTLLDADLESDILGWKYVSGCLTDGHELDRVLDPHEEGCKLDPKGEYVRRWLPELSRLPNQWIHHPYSAPVSRLQAAGVELGTNYPKPIVDMEVAKYRLSQAVKSMREKNSVEQAARTEEGQDETNPRPNSQHNFPAAFCDQLVPSILTTSASHTQFSGSVTRGKHITSNLP
ncbi:hypothetical protein SELMODRAFT_92414 [Selaginella moellendorffii]|uniref:Uncharacterized protein CRY3-1 n=1 Tax=Selaginella moellendorffii TaxID=88036 RepID=D8RF17_SELML|nr:hypothetical protein SELMODRAFT_92414 [Selaginella moellendorffii]